MPKKPAKPDGSKRDLLIDTALCLFARNGYRATGIDTILAEAGVAKMTLYHHFKSKDDLIVAALKKRDEEWRGWFQSSLEAKAPDARGRLNAIFVVLEEWFRRKDFHGCSFGQAATEFREPKHVVHRTALEHKQRLHTYLSELAGAAGARDAGLLASQLELLIEGAVIHMEVFRESEVARTAGEAAGKLITLECG